MAESRCQWETFRTSAVMTTIINCLCGRSEPLPLDYFCPKKGAETSEDPVITDPEEKRNAIPLLERAFKSVDNGQ